MLAMSEMPKVALPTTEDWELLGEVIETVLRPDLAEAFAAMGRAFWGFYPVSAEQPRRVYRLGADAVAWRDGRWRRCVRFDGRWWWTE